MKTLKILFVTAALLVVPAVNAQLSGTMKVVGKYSDLVNLVRPSTQNPLCLVLGGAAANDGGGGLFYWTASSSASTNYGVIASTLDTTGQWIRVYGSQIGTRPPRVQSLLVGTATVAEAPSIQVVGSGGAVTITAAPSIADGTAGQELTIEGTDDTNTVTYQDQGSLASSNLQLGSASRALGAGDILRLKFNTTLSTWQEIGFVNN